MDRRMTRDRSRGWRMVAAAAVTGAMALVMVSATSLALDCVGTVLVDGCLFTNTGGDTPYPDDGFAVTNADDVPLWDFVRARSADAIGYPISQRWVNGPFTFQAFQKVILQWDPGKQRMNYYNTLDVLASRYPEVKLPNVPAHQVLEADQGVTDFAVIMRNHLALLEQNAAIKDRFLSEADWLNLYGLPIRYEEREVNGHPQGLQMLRTQRTVFVIWNVPAPGVTVGRVNLQNVPDKVKRLSDVIIPDAAKRPIGDLLVFSSSRDGETEIYVMRPDGSSLTQLTHNESWDGAPRWSPDGRHIAFGSLRDGDSEIYVMGADGSNVTQLTHNGASDWSPKWSPDGRRIAFHSDRDGDFEIFVMAADGSYVMQLTHNDVTDAVPGWSPDGRRIAFQSERDGDFEIYVMGADGSDVTQLTDSGGADWDAAWSPDGQRLAFVSDRDGDRKVYVMGADGSDVTQLSHATGADGAPDWSPDGRRIAFNSDLDGNYEIFVMGADGSGLTQLTDNDAFDAWPGWSPVAVAIPIPLG